MSTYGNVIKNFLNGDAVNLDLEKIGGLKFLDDVFLAREDAIENSDTFVGTKTIGNCFEGTYEIYSLRGAVTATGRFDKFNLSLAIDADHNIVVIVQRGNETATHQLGRHRLENLFLLLVELFRK